MLHNPGLRGCAFLRFWRGASSWLAVGLEENDGYTCDQGDNERDSYYESQAMVRHFHYLCTLRQWSYTQASIELFGSRA